MEEAGTVVRLRRYPVKSMLGEDLEGSHVGERGLKGDRAFGVVDTATGKLASAKRPRLWGSLLDFSASFKEPVVAEQTLPPVWITFPDGAVRSSEEPGIDDELTRALGRPVRLMGSHDDLLYFEEVWYGDLKDGAQPYGPVIGEEDGEQVIDVPASIAAPEGFFDATAIHLVTTSTLRRLAEVAPSSSFVPERFRPNLVIDIPDADGFVENDWPGRFLEIGDDVRLEIVMRVPRCVVTTLPQGDLSHDPDVLRTIARHNKVGAFISDYPCVGAYANVVGAGSVRIGDRVRPA